MISCERSVGYRSHEQGSLIVILESSVKPSGHGVVVYLRPSKILRIENYTTTSEAEQKWRITPRWGRKRNVSRNDEG